MRQLLADKISGNLVGLWLLVPEHLRLGTWDLLCGWTQQPAQQVQPRLALQLVHEAALCITGRWSEAEGLLRLFKWGETFLTLNRDPLTEYGRAAGVEEVLRIEGEYFPTPPVRQVNGGVWPAS